MSACPSNGLPFTWNHRGPLNILVDFEVKTKPYGLYAADLDFEFVWNGYDVTRQETATVQLTN